MLILSLTLSILEPWTVRAYCNSYSSPYLKTVLDFETFSLDFPLVFLESAGIIFMDMVCGHHF